MQWSPSSLDWIPNCVACTIGVLHKFQTGNLKSVAFKIESADRSKQARPLFWSPSVVQFKSGGFQRYSKWMISLELTIVMYGQFGLQVKWWWTSLQYRRTSILRNKHDHFIALPTDFHSSKQAWPLHCTADGLPFFETSTTELPQT